MLKGTFFLLSCVDKSNSGLRSVVGERFFSHMIADNLLSLGPNTGIYLYRKAESLLPGNPGNSEIDRLICQARADRNNFLD